MSESARPLSEWHEDHGPALWWHFPIVEPPYVGTPLDDDWPVDYLDSKEVDYCTHWTPIPMPPKPWPSDKASEGQS